MSIESAGEHPQLNFEQQFRERKTYDYTDHKVQIAEVIPEDLSDDVPVFIVPGWSEDPDTYKESLREVYRGYAVEDETGIKKFKDKRKGLTINFDRTDFPIEGEEILPEIEVRKAQQIIEALTSQGITQTDAIFHSEGAINGLIAATLRPDLFRNIVLDKPAGLIGKDSKASLIGRFLKLMAQESSPRLKRSPKDPNFGITASMRVARYIATNPVGTLSELEPITTTDIAGLIYGLSERGVMVSMISGAHDPLFPVAKQLAHLRSKQDQSGFTFPFEGFATVVGGHNELSLNESKHTRLTLDLLKNMQRRRELGKITLPQKAEVNPFFSTLLQTFQSEHGTLKFRDIIPDKIRENGG